jgi:hypothetical protein
MGTRGFAVACPYFIPSEPHKRELWAHRERLPLGDGFTGRCGAPAAGNEAGDCDDERLRLQCNLGYANLGYANLGYANAGSAGCMYLPAERDFDAVRFLLTSDGPTKVRLQFACELAQRPALCGELRYDRVTESWIAPPDPRLAALAEATVRAWISRHPNAG